MEGGERCGGLLIVLIWLQSENVLDNDGDLSQVQSKKANDTFRNYANGFNYTAAGAVERKGSGLRFCDFLKIEVEFRGYGKKASC